MVAEFDGIKVKIPNGYVHCGNGIYMNGHGVEYGLVSYGRGKDAVICLETIYSKHTRTIKLEKVVYGGTP